MGAIFIQAGLVCFVLCAMHDTTARYADTTSSSDAQK